MSFLQDQIFIACDKGQLNEVKMLLYQNPGFDINSETDYCFRHACKSGNLRLAIWLKETYPSIDITAGDDWAFRYTCEEGHLEMAQWLVETGAAEENPINIHANSEDAFRSACKYSRLDVVEWLLEYGLKIGEPIHVQEQRYEAFYIACLNGDLKLAKLLLDKYPNIDPGKTFTVSCRYGHLEMAKWLMEKFPQSSLECISETMYDICCNGNAEIFQWLLTFPLDKKISKERLFSTACWCGYLDIAKILAEMFPDLDVHAFDDSAYRSITEKGDVDMIRWFLDRYPETKVSQ